MSTFNRLKSSTAVIATLAAGMVLLAASGHANAKSGNGSNGRQNQGGAANSAAANSAPKTAPNSGHDMPRRDMIVRDLSDRGMSGRDMSAQDKSDHGDKHDKERDRERLGDGKHKMPQPGGKPVETTNGGKDLFCRGFVGCNVPKLGDGKTPQPAGKPVETTGGKPTQSSASSSGTPSTAKPAPVATPAPGTGGTNAIPPIATPAGGTTPAAPAPTAMGTISVGPNGRSFAIIARAETPAGRVEPPLATPRLPA
jgi:hypothetical protein